MSDIPQKNSENIQAKKSQHVCWPNIPLRNPKGNTTISIDIK